MLRRIERPQWVRFCEALNSELLGMRAEIEVASMDLGVQVEAKWLPVVGVAYDRKDDAFEIILDGGLEHLDHLIFHPVEVYAEFGPQGIEHMAIVERDAWQIVLVRPPLMLPRPS